MSGRINNNRRARHRRPEDALHESALLNSLPSDANGIGVARRTGGANVDVIVAVGQATPGTRTQTDVIRAGNVFERVRAIRRVVIADFIHIERIITGRSVAIADGIKAERTNPGSGIDVTGCIVEKRAISGGRVEVAVTVGVSGIVIERFIPGSRVAVAGGVA